MESIAGHKTVNKVLLIQPWRDARSSVFGEMEPYALMTLASTLVKYGIDVRILDLRIEKRALKKTLQAFKPQLVGVTAITIDFYMANKVLTQVKEFNPKIITVIGGIHATLSPFDFKNKLIDFIVRGPGTKVLTEIISQINGSRLFETIKGILYRDSNLEFIENKPWTSNISKEAVNVLPLRNILRKQFRYRCFGFNYAVLSTAQGCSGRCAFCACWPAMGGQYIAKTPVNVLNEIKDIVNNGQRHIFLADDNTFEDIDRAFEIASLISNYLKKAKVKITFSGYCRADIIANDPDLFNAWEQVGLKYLTVGIEATSDKELNKLNKNSSTKINLQANKILVRLKIINLAHILIDPFFIQNDFDRIWEFIYKNGITNPIFPILTGLPGTILFDSTTGPNLYPYFDLAHPIARTRLPLLEFFQSFKRLVLKNYSYTRWLKSRCRSLMNLIYLKIGLKALYPDHECKAPQFITIPYNRYFIKQITNHRKLKPFMKDFMATY